MSEDLLALLKELQLRYQISEDEMEVVAQAIETEIAEAANGGMMVDGGEMMVDDEVPVEGGEY